jgi:class 3 adenylate cyclase
MRIKSRIDEDEFVELVRPKLKLFLSVDIVGSTSFKQRDKDSQSQAWLNLFVSFFSEFPTLLCSEVADCGMPLDSPRLWKSLGDELIFTVELKHRTQAAVYLKAFAATLRKAAQNWHTDVKDPARKELHLKGTAWLAGFPVGNVEIPLDTHVDAKHSDGRDYIGPLIDTGFRLKEFATSRKLVISADLTYLILSVGISGMALFFDGEHTLKGVLRSKPYPIIWLDCEGHPAAEHTNPSARMNRLKDGLRQCKSADTEDLKEYLKYWLESCHSFLCTPFIFQDSFQDLRPSADYPEKLARATADLRGVFYVGGGGSESQQTEGATSIPTETTDLFNSLPSPPGPFTL